MKYNKLVRDGVPEIIKKEGKTPITHTVNPDNYEKCLLEKLKEEIKEFLENGETSELIDVLEVVYAISEHKGISKEALEKMRKDKAKERGSFKKGIILEEVK